MELLCDVSSAAPPRKWETERSGENGNAPASARETGAFASDSLRGDGAAGYQQKIESP